MSYMETSLLEMSRVALVIGSLMLITSIVFLTRGISRMRSGEPFFGKGSSTVFVLLGFAFFAMGILLFLFGVFRLSM